MLRQSASERKEARAISITWQKNSSAFIWLILTSEKDENAESGLILNKIPASGNGLPRQRRGSVERIIRSRLAFARDFDKRNSPSPPCRGLRGQVEKLPPPKRKQIVQILDAFLGSEKGKKTGGFNTILRIFTP